MGNAALAHPDHGSNPLAHPAPIRSYLVHACSFHPRSCPRTCAAAAATGPGGAVRRRPGGLRHRRSLRGRHRSAAAADGRPGLPVIAAETYRRTPAAEVTQFDPAAFGELFGAVRIDLTYPQALQVRRKWKADLIVAEREDVLGPMVAAALGVPWARFLLGVDLPAEVTAAITARAQQRYAGAGLTVEAPLATIDPWPESLQPPQWRPAPDRIVIRPEPHTGAADTSLPSRPMPAAERCRLGRGRRCWSAPAPSLTTRRR